ncbi:MAG: insulinase family protein [Clostridia bacterium]|nr:insulinase family protein [Clostridia bacterium]
MEITKMENNKFKTNEIAIFLTLPLKRETITMNALIPSVLRRGSATYKNQIEIGKQLENMYGAFFNCGIDKTGDYCILKFYIETLSDRFLPNGETVSQKSMDMLWDIIFNPLADNNSFNKEYVKQEKENLRKIIESKKDNKELYAFDRCIEEMFKNDSYGIYKNGYIEDLEKINESNLYEYYKQIINDCKIDIILNGIDAKSISINKEIYNKDNTTVLKKSEKKNKKINMVKEKADVIQGKLILGLRAPEKNKYAISLYNAILGGGANSKLFQNVREKASLAYSIGSRYIRRKDVILIITGIELKNYEKALRIIKQQINEMKSGNITNEELEKSRQLIISSLDMLKESQENMISFEFDQKLFKENLTIDKYKEKIEKITLKEVIDIAQKVEIDTIYYLEK